MKGLVGGRLGSDANSHPFPERTQTRCPSCESSNITALPPNNPGSLQEWFTCGTCGHMWSQRRDRTEQGTER